MTVFTGGIGPGIGWLFVLMTAPAAGYVGLYFLFRCWGKLRVNADGWHAAGIFAGSRVVLSALRLFGVYEPLLRVESGVARRLRRLFRSEESRDQLVSEVVVELIPLT